MPDFKLELGAKAKDHVTGFSGTITGRAEYLTGCRQYCIAAKAEGNKCGQSEWFDEDRLLPKKRQAAKSRNQGGPQTNEAPRK